MTSPDHRAAPEWIRVGKGSLRTIVLVSLAITAGMAVFIAAPMTEFAPLLFGTTVPWIVGYLVSIVVCFVLIGPFMLPRATRPVYVSAATSQFRVGRRVLSVAELHHAYRLPDSQFDDRFQLRLSVPGIDAVIPISARPPVELSPLQLDALIALIELAPIEPDPRVTLRPPFGDELGARDSVQRFTDDLARTLVAFETMGYAKATLLTELRIARQTSVGATEGDAPAIVRDLGVVAPFTTNAPKRLDLMAEVAAIADEPGTSRGFWGMLSRSYRADLAAVQSWASSVDTTAPGEPPVTSSTSEPWTSPPARKISKPWQRPAGLAVIIFGFAAPWLFILPLVGIYLFPALQRDSMTTYAVLAFFIFTWPFIVWAGAVLNWRGRVGVYESVRAETFAIRARGVVVPENIARFFGPTFADVAYRDHAIIFFIVQSVLFLGGGLTTIAASNGQVQNWSQNLVGVPIGALMVIASAPIFFMAIGGKPPTAVLHMRAVRLWKAIRGVPDPAAARQE
ncbi:MAG: hypothetical protein ACOH1T_00315 [Microbacteriaceae bacterium]